MKRCEEPSTDHLTVTVWNHGAVQPWVDVLAVSVVCNDGSIVLHRHDCLPAAELVAVLHRLAESIAEHPEGFVEERTEP